MSSNNFIEVKLTHFKDGKVEVIRELIIYPFWSPAEIVMEDIIQMVGDEKGVVER